MCPNREASIHEGTESLFNQTARSSLRRAEGTSRSGLMTLPLLILPFGSLKLFYVDVVCLAVNYLEYMVFHALDGRDQNQRYGTDHLYLFFLSQ